MGRLELGIVGGLFSILNFVCAAYAVPPPVSFAPPSVRQINSLPSASYMMSKSPPAVGNFNGDSIPDLVFPNFLGGAGQIPWLGGMFAWGDGVAAFLDIGGAALAQKHTPYVMSSVWNGETGIVRLITADIGNDGKDDLIAITAGGSVRVIWQGLQSAFPSADTFGSVSGAIELSQIFTGVSFQSTSRFRVPIAMALKLDGDAYPELVISGFMTHADGSWTPTGMVVLKGTATGFDTQNPQVFPPPSTDPLEAAIDAEFVDRNGDGTPETLAVLKEAPTPSSTLGSGSFYNKMEFWTWQTGGLQLEGGVAQMLNWLTGTRVVGFTTADFNGDSYLDYVAASNIYTSASQTGFLFIGWGDSTGSVDTLSSSSLFGSWLPSGSRYLDVAIGDLNGDHEPEVVATRAVDPSFPGPDMNVKADVYESPNVTVALPVEVDLGSPIYGNELSARGHHESIMRSNPGSIMLLDLNYNGLPELVVSGVQGGGANAGYSVVMNTTQPPMNAPSVARNGTGSQFPEFNNVEPLISLSGGGPTYGNPNLHVCGWNLPSGASALTFFGVTLPPGGIPYYVDGWSPANSFTLYAVPVVFSGNDLTVGPSGKAVIKIPTPVPSQLSLLGAGNIGSVQIVFYHWATDRWGSTGALDITIGN